MSFFSKYSDDVLTLLALDEPKLAALEMAALVEVVFVPIDPEAVEGVELEAFTDGDACDPGDEDAAMAAFLACCALAASLGKE